MEIHGKQIDDAKLAAARKSFERNQESHGRKGKLRFDEILDRLAANCSLADIARAHGVRRQMMSSIHGHYFQDLFLDRATAHERMWARTLKRAEVAERDLSLGGLAPWVKAIAEMALRHGLSVCRRRRSDFRLAHSASLHSFRKNELLINDKVCLLRHVASIRRCSGGKRHYNVFEVEGLSRGDFLVIYQEAQQIGERRVFIVPIDDVKKVHGEAERIYIMLPIERTVVYRTRHPLVDWFHYEDAWHLLQACGN